MSFEASIQLNSNKQFVSESNDGSNFVYISTIHEVPEQYRYLLPGRDAHATTLECGTFLRVSQCKEQNNTLHRHWCYRRACPICYPAAIYRQSSKIISKVGAFASWNTLYHWEVSFGNFSDDQLGSNDFLQKRFKDIIKFFYAGVAFYHPLALNDETEIWYRHPHFHLITPVEFLGPNDCDGKKGKGCDKCKFKQIFEKELEEGKWDKKRLKVKKEFSGPLCPAMIYSLMLRQGVDMSIHRIKVVLPGIDQITRCISYEMGHASLVFRTKFFGEWAIRGYQIKKFQVEQHHLLCSCKKCVEKNPQFVSSRSYLMHCQASCVTESRDEQTKGGTKYWIIKTQIEVTHVTDLYRSLKKDFLWIPKSLDIYELRLFLSFCGYLEHVDQISDQYYNTISVPLIN